MAKKTARNKPADEPAQGEAGDKGAQKPRQAKNIVLCSDGTGNSGGKASGTNVWSLSNAVWRGPNSEGKLPPKTQITFYDDGVGTHAFKPFRILGGAFGFGYSRNVRELYKSLALTYDPGDRIHVFGFSRGAYTVRVLSGLILGCGILNRHDFEQSAELDKAVESVFRAYRKRYRTIYGRAMRALSKPDDSKRDEAAKGPMAPPHDHPVYPLEQTRIAFIGVWDTVDAIGMPMDWMSDLLNLIFPFKFPDHNLSDRVDKACHALAIDDERRTFWPVMWNEKGEETGRIEQVWFPGVHSNVGGGYPKDQMAEVSLDWMMRHAHAEGEGLHFYDDKWNAVREGANAHGKLYDSRAGLAAYYRYGPRDMLKICRGRGFWRRLCEKLLRDKNRCTAFFGPAVEIKRPKVHFSALRRASRATEDYAPVYLTEGVEVVATDLERDEPLRDRLSKAHFDTAETRAFRLDAAHQVVIKQRILYHLFLAYTFGILVAAAWFLWCPRATARAPAEVTWPAPFEWTFNLIGKLVPDFLASFLAPLFGYLKANPLDLAVVVAALLALLIAKGRFERDLRRKSLDAWQVFREYLYNNKKS